MLTGNKDVDREILLKLSNRDLLNACASSKYALNEVCNDTFFYNRLSMTYPELISSKPYKMKWRQYYLNIIKNIYKLDEDFGFKYTTKSKGSPMEYFKMISEDNFEKGFETAVLEGKKDLAEYFKEKLDDYIYNIAFILAVKSNDKETIDYLIELGGDTLGGNDWNNGLFEAANNGNLEFINFFIEKGANINEGLKGASKRGDMELVKFFIEKGANQWNEAIIYSSYGKGLKAEELVSFFINKLIIYLLFF